ncbi:MAG TPA: flagellar protein FlgN [Candidatus Limnocylindria bacterium]|jgi:flagellar biosynthesis/type III secretory pathway chaperone|nr:flagellar protein FlgN [Candidatus Limnocylindria bacterium]
METLKRLIHQLRDELQQYGEMLARLDQQQELVLHRAADDLLQSIDAVQSQALAIQTARGRREKLQHDLARELALEDPAFSTLIPALPGDYRPLVHALVSENNELLVRVQQRARQNHLLLMRSMESMQKLINTLMPATGTPVYNDSGYMAARPASRPALLEIVG